MILQKTCDFCRWLWQYQNDSYIIVENDNSLYAIFSYKNLKTILLKNVSVVPIVSEFTICLGKIILDCCSLQMIIGIVGYLLGWVRSKNQNGDVNTWYSKNKFVSIIILCGSTASELIFAAKSRVSRLAMTGRRWNH